MHEDSILWVWTTNYHMQVIPDLLRCWDFRHVTMLTWAKDQAGAGDWLRGQTEQTGHLDLAPPGGPRLGWSDL
jgi:N6-adenosine-specific RNA methylase IME4